MKSLSKKNLILLAVGGLLLICVFWSFSTYNSLVGQDEVSPLLGAMCKLSINAEVISSLTW